MTGTGDDAKARKRDAMQRVSVVQEISRRWDPIGGWLVPADEYDSYAPQIVFMVAGHYVLKEFLLLSVRRSTCR
jgi:hypothetical protein